jgi:hypothetical protein
MQHVAIDLGGRESQICVRRTDESIVEETRWPTRRLSAYLEKLPPSRVILETSSEGNRPGKGVCRGAAGWWTLGRCVEEAESSGCRWWPGTSAAVSASGSSPTGPASPS